MSKLDAETLSSESPLHYFSKISSHPVSSNQLFNGDLEFGVVAKEVRLGSQLNLRGDVSDEQFVTGTAAVLGVALPTVPGTYQYNSDTVVYWLGPNEWLVTSATDAIELELSLRLKINGHIAIVDVSGGQTLVNLRGHGVQGLLKKASGYDFASWNGALPGIGRCAQTTFAKATAIVGNRTDGSFDLIIRRSFSDYIAQWLLDACQEVGCRIESC
ncbi:MAG: sarcosine oxidase subunit gamma family protein [Porticoccaceae bacterium]|nr:sarcosine oxidase subunit gamma family protein [Porticoccaceae bacterium]